MRNFEWNKDKNKELIKVRGISFEEIVVAIHEKRVLDIYEHPRRDNYTNQYIAVVEVNRYAYLVPFVIKDEATIFLKTIIPSRKATKKYLGEYHEKGETQS